MDELIERTRLAAKILRDIGGQSAMAATVEEAAAALEAAREAAERYRWALNNSCWIRGEHAAYVAIPVARDADLSCVAMRDTAIDQARGKAGGEVGP